MIDRLLKSHLEPVARSSQKWQLWRGLALCWAVLALAGWAAVRADRSHGWYSPLTFFVLAAAGIAAVFVVLRHFRSRPLDYQAIARQIELENPELHALLLTAVEQQPLSPGGDLNYLQQRVVLEALAHYRRSSWAAGMTRRHRLALGAHWVAFGCFAAALVSLLPHFSLSLPGGLWASAEQSNGVLVTPGDAQMERGSSLVVLARFNGRLPASAELVVSPDTGGEQRIALTKNLDDPVFGGGLPELKSNLKYHIEFSGGRTRDFKIGVFEYPRLEHADVTINYPPYTGVAQKFIKNTRRVSALEGSTLDYAFYLNKAVVSAKLVATNGTAVSLAADATNAALYHTKIELTESRRYQLVLVDDAGRSNKVPPEFVLEALKNHPPVVRLTAPRGDQNVSALEEMNFAGEVSGEYGVKSYGIAYALGGNETTNIELGQAAKAGEKRQLAYTLPLESLGAQPDELLSYYLWADDTGPDGQPRHTTSDIYFAEIKPFEQVFREAQQPDAGGDQNNNNQNNNRGQNGGQQGNRPDSLANLEKQIVTATFNLQRRESAAKPSAKYKDDVQVVQNSQQDALDQVRDLKQQNDDPAQAPYLDSAEKAMTTATRQLGEAVDKNSVAPLPPALTAEQTAYQAVLKLSAREFQVARGQRGQRGGQQQRGGQRMQAQLNQLDLAQQNNQYQTQRQANTDQNNQTPQQQEQMQVANRLKELAQRQQDLNQRIRELQASLQEARTEQQRADIQEQLKRLTEEQQNVLSDVDELRQRMDQMANQQQGQQQPGDQQQGDQQPGDQQQARLDDGQQPQPDGQQQPGDQQPGQQPDGQQQPGGQRQGGQRQGGQRQGGQQQQANQQGAQLAQQRQQLDQTRDEVQNAADQLARNNPDQALSSGTRAQQDLQQLQDDVRRLNSAQFSEEMRRMRNDARQLDQNQTDIGNQINQLANPAQRQLSETDEQRQLRQDLAARLLQQENGASNLLTQMRQVSDQAETSEPILSQQLYDTIRQTQQDEMNSALDSSSELVRRGFVQQAGPYESRAQQDINQLRNGVDQAAQGVLGDGTEALRLAQRELDQLDRELNQPGIGTNDVNGTNRQFAAGQRNGAARSGRNGQNAQRGQGRNGQPGQDQNQPGDNRGQLAGGENPGGQPPDARGGGAGQRNGQRNGGNRAGGAGNGANGQNPELAGGPGSTNVDDVMRRLMQQRSQEEAGVTNGADLAGGPGGMNATNESELQRQLTVRRQQAAAGRTNGLDLAGDPGRVGTNEPGADFAGGPRGGNLVNGGGAYQGGEYNGPIVDTNFIAWSDRLRVTEEMLTDVPDLSTQVAQIRDRARALRLTFRRDGTKPDWAVVTEQIGRPLAEVRARVDEELLKRTSKEALVPLDRDPVPSQYSERVRRYYEQLGKSE